MQPLYVMIYAKLWCRQGGQEIPDAGREMGG